MNSFNEQGDTRPAIFYGKQAVNAFQSIRGDLKESQATFVKNKEQAYRTLANLLLSEGWLAEARELEETVFAFRTALSSDQYDPQPLAENLYDKLFRQTSARQTTTLEADLNELLGSFGNRTIRWSLDGVLRYIPVAALHDGKQYLVEKYRNIIFTQQGLAGLNKADKKWRVLGLGVSEQRENFAALPGVNKELEDIARQPSETTGILEGMRRLDGDFTKEETLLLWSRGAYAVVHIASHFSFNPLDQQASFLLLGDGRLTFAEMWGRRGLFNAVALLALSACDTAVSGNGKESEGFAFLAQRLGANTVIASLWKVSDEGTPELMTRFYKLRAENPQVPKGEAFRQAQLSLLGTEAVTDEDNRPAARRAELAVAVGMEVKLPAYVRDARRPFAHPYYWSSFVLIGNWK